MSKLTSTEQKTRRLNALKVLARFTGWTSAAPFAEAVMRLNSSRPYAITGMTGKGVPPADTRAAGMTLRGLWMRGLAERKHTSTLNEPPVYRISATGRTESARAP